MFIASNLSTNQKTHWKFEFKQCSLKAGLQRLRFLADADQGLPAFEEQFAVGNGD
jgi:hypothetical protein